MMRSRPGASARALLGGDERLHVFCDTDASASYLSRIPGARTFAPRRPGWGNVLHDAIVGSIRCRDVDVEIEFTGPRRSASTVLEIAVALYDKGANSVSINGGLVRMPERHQEWRR